ncbi:PRA1 family protein 2 isoform X2 [Erythrolamprus reginae]|uniref:PRA1 family protein 2 isoform X2 n=1 Tax=Erythrolamprus reginae TaxID=121349 RepID=UPI00396C620D
MFETARALFYAPKSIHTVTWEKLLEQLKDHYTPPHSRCARQYFQPMLILVSCLLVCLLFGGFVWAAENKPPVRRFRRNYPGTCFFAVLGAAYFLVSLFEGSATFLVFIALPIMLSLIHASLRLRNLKNKIENKIENIGLKRTPMGLLLEAVGQEQEAGS